MERLEIVPSLALHDPGYHFQNNRLGLLDAHIPEYVGMIPRVHELLSQILDLFIRSSAELCAVSSSEHPMQEFPSFQPKSLWS
jgi:hypothetical protein